MRIDYRACLKCEGSVVYEPNSEGTCLNCGMAYYPDDCKLLDPNTYYPSCHRVDARVVAKPTNHQD